MWKLHIPLRHLLGPWYFRLLGSSLFQLVESQSPSGNTWCWSLMFSKYTLVCLQQQPGRPPTASVWRKCACARNWKYIKLHYYIAFSFVFDDKDKGEYDTCIKKDARFIYYISMLTCYTRSRCSIFPALSVSTTGPPWERWLCQDTIPHQIRPPATCARTRSTSRWPHSTPGMAGWPGQWW